MRHFSKKAINVHFQGRTLVGDILSQNSTTDLLMLHGGGNANRQRFEPLRMRLFSMGVSSCAFDFLGSGDSDGDMGTTTLASRTHQARQVIDTVQMGNPFSIIGASMGAHTAIMLLKYYPVDNLILFVPAIYASKAYRVPFNSGFSKIIRIPQSWRDSDAWGLLTDFAGGLFLVTSENDDVIPRTVPEKIYESAQKARKRIHWTLPAAPHQVIAYFNTVGKQWFDRVVHQIAALLKSS
ncbi:MAG: alpha/beta hydrolase [Deltaproteobacteria bacterium]|jgi:pimeloyl-ACP methyl ester carboxylesterase|nr:alpha/beta hydrolase [Deltaproteobacteria bacterium]